MAIPTLWSLQSERLRYTTANGWETVQTWTGPGGAGMVTRDAWLANFSGYTSLEIEHQRPRDDGDAIVTAQIGFAVTPAGTPIPPTSPDFGLISRRWTKHTNKLQSTLLSHPRVELLDVQDASWGYRLRTQARAYDAALKKFARGELVIEPDPREFMDRARPASIGPVTGALLETEIWLFAEFAIDEDASWEMSMPVLRKTEEVISSTRLKAVHQDTDRFHTYAALQRIESSLALAIIVDAAQLEAWFWLKTSPEVEETSGGRFQIVQEYEGWPYLSPNTLMRYGPLIT